jgi:hypothetical protein
MAEVAELQDTEYSTPNNLDHAASNLFTSGPPKNSGDGLPTNPDNRPDRTTRVAAATSSSPVVIERPKGSVRILVPPNKAKVSTESFFNTSHLPIHFKFRKTIKNLNHAFFKEPTDWE